MIGEFAFTPSVFAPEAHQDRESWRENLRELAAEMFPKTAAWPVMVANLYDGAWFNLVLNAVKEIKEDRTRILCEGILENIHNSLVHRPGTDAGWPMDDIGWGREALASSDIEPVDRIVSCRTVQDMLAPEGHTLRCIDEVQATGFWKNITSQWLQPMDLNSQVQTIRKLAVYSEFLCVITPHARGTADDETEFIRRITQTAFTRPPGFPAAEIEVHSEGPDNPTKNDFSDRLRRAATNLTISLTEVLHPRQTVRLVLWPKLLDRYLIAGVYTASSGGKRMRSPRWGISMNHIARPLDDRPATSWSLMTRSQLGDVFNRHCTGTPTGSLYDAVVAGR